MEFITYISYFWLTCRYYCWFIICSACSLHTMDKRNIAMDHYGFLTYLCFYRWWTTICLKSEFNGVIDRKSTRLNSSHVSISYAVFCLKKKMTHDEEMIES